MFKCCTANFYVSSLYEPLTDSHVFELLLNPEVALNTTTDTCEEEVAAEAKDPDMEAIFYGSDQCGGDLRQQFNDPEGLCDLAFSFYESQLVSGANFTEGNFTDDDAVAQASAACFRDLSAELAGSSFTNAQIASLAPAAAAFQSNTVNDDPGNPAGFTNGSASYQQIIGLLG